MKKALYLFVMFVCCINLHAEESLTENEVYLMSQSCLMKTTIGKACFGAEEIFLKYITSSEVDVASFKAEFSQYWKEQGFKDAMISKILDKELNRLNHLREEPKAVQCMQDRIDFAKVLYQTESEGEQLLQIKQFADKFAACSIIRKDSDARFDMKSAKARL